MQQAIIVLGMHRSGTSAVAGALATLGAAPPANLMPAHPDNPKGYWESAPLARLNDTILDSVGSAWHDWRPISDAWFETQAATDAAAEIARLLKLEFTGEQPIVLKDPRICRLVPLWRRALQEVGYNPVVAAPIRRPAEVAASLARRNDFSVGRAYLIWLRHVLESERTTRDLPRVVFRWSDFMRDWRGVLSRLSNEAGAHFKGWNLGEETAVDAFLDAGLRRQNHDGAVSPDAPEWIEPAFQALTRLATQTDHEGAKTVLDEIRQEFDRTAAIYGPIFAGLETEYYQFEKLFEARQEAISRQAVKTAQPTSTTEKTLQDLHEDNARIREALQKTEKARIDTEAGWAAEREARQSVENALQATEHARVKTEAGWAAERGVVEAVQAELASARLQLETANDALLVTNNEVRRHFQVQVTLEEEIARLEAHRHRDAAEQAMLTYELQRAKKAADRHIGETQAVQDRLRALVARRRAQPIRTAWAILRGRDG